MPGRDDQSANRVPRRDVRLVDVLRAAAAKTQIDLSVAYPCEILAFDTTNQLATVKVHFQHVFVDETGEQIFPPEELPGVLVGFAGQARPGGGYLTFPIAVGDRGYVTVFDRSLDNWIEDGEPNDPKLYTLHQRIDGVFMPVRDKTRAVASYDQVAAVLESTLIKLGADATEAAVLGDTLRSWALDLTTWLTAHVHTGVTTGPGSTGTAGFAPTVPNFLSTKVRVE